MATYPTREVNNTGQPLTSPDGTILTGTKIRFTLVNGYGNAVDVIDATTLERVVGTVEVTTDGSGEFSVNLWPNSRGNSPTQYLVTVDHPAVQSFKASLAAGAGAIDWVTLQTAGLPLSDQEISALNAHIAATGTSVHGLGTMSTQNAGAVAITGGSITGVTGVILDSEVGTVVQAHSAVLDGTTASYTLAEESKLAGIEAGADVTDTANVTAAGALMDSEVDPDIKTLSLPASTTISTFGASLVDDADAAAARTTLGLGTIATQNANAISITGGTITGITDLAIADGGTGASTAAGARTNLGLVAGGAGDIWVEKAGDVMTGQMTHTGLLVSQRTNPRFILTQTDAAADNQNWEIEVGGEQFRLGASNDAFSAQTNFMQVERTGTTIDTVAFPNGNVLIGTTTPATGSPKLDVLGQATFSTVASDATNKFARLNVRHYTNAEEAVSMIASNITSSANLIAYGGGDNSLNAATQHSFYTAANTTTPTGTEIARLTNSENTFRNPTIFGVAPGTGPTSGVDLEVRNTSPVLRLASDTVPTTNYFQLVDANTTTGQIQKASTSGNSSLIDLEPLPLDGTSAALIRLFRTTNTSGSAQFSILRGDGTATTDHQFVTGTSGNLVTLNRSGGLAIFGHSGAITGPGPSATKLEVFATDSTAGLESGRFSNDAGGCLWSAFKSRGATIGSNGIVANGDAVLTIIGGANDGTDNQTGVCEILMAVNDASPASNAIGGQTKIRTATTGGTMTDGIICDAAQAIFFPGVGTTGSGANAFLNSGAANQLLRSTSSRRYKHDIVDLDPEKLSVLQQLRPIRYRSRAIADDPMAWHYGLIAEEVAEVEPELVQFTKLTDPLTEDDDNPLGKTSVVPDSVQYDRIVPLLVAQAQKDSAHIAELEIRYDELEERLAAVEKKLAA